MTHLQPLLVEAKIEPVPARLGQLGMGGGAVSEVDEFDRRKGLFECVSDTRRGRRPANPGLELSRG